MKKEINNTMEKPQEQNEEMKKKITHNEPIYCGKKGCKKIIGHRGYNKRERWYEGV